MKKNAFTLVELIGIIVILGLMLIVGVPALTKTLKKVNNDEYERFKKDLELATENYVVQNIDMYPELETVGGEVYITLEELKQQGYIKSSIIDPSNDLTYEDIKNNTIKVYKNSSGVLEYDYQNNASYEYLVYKFIVAAKKYAVNNISSNADLNTGIYITLNELKNADYIDENIIDPSTGNQFNYNTTVEVREDNENLVAEYTGQTNGINSYVQDGLIFQFDGIYNDGKYVNHNLSKVNLLNLISGDTCSITGNPTWSSNSLVLDGSTYVECIQLSGTATTLEVVFSQDAILPSASQQVVTTWYYAGDSSPTGLGVYTNNTYINSIFSCSSCANGYSVVNVNTLTSDSENKFYVFISAGNVNGTRFGSNQNRDFSTSYGFTNSSKKLTIGSLPDNTGEKFSGKIYAIRVYNRDLTGAEISQNYNVDKIRFNIED